MMVRGLVDPPPPPQEKAEEEKRIYSMMLDEYEKRLIERYRTISNSKAQKHLRRVVKDLAALSSID